jgi:hypothetical protein
MSTGDARGEGKEKAAWGIALGILAYWGLRILGRDRPLKVEPDKERKRAPFRA